MPDGTPAVTIAVIGDTHDGGGDLDGMLAAIDPILDGVDAILHTGDVVTAETLDRLEAYAPVTAVRSEADPQLPPRLTDGPRAATWAGVRVELHRWLDEPEIVERDDVEVVVSGGTHEPSIRSIGRTVYINPGAPVFAKTPSLALLRLSNGRVRATLVFL